MSCLTTKTRKNIVHGFRKKREETKKRETFTQKTNLIVPQKHSVPPPHTHHRPIRSRAYSVLLLTTENRTSKSSAQILFNRFLQIFLFFFAQ